ncbi:transmembrane 6 superfamily member 1-like [Centruroides sculpturatus]|uniref:transmembrane 6 superfamily member 1-like n=1 Tax=Centruroides sculpturatus TaxID=218467 RepID=UPI000C6C8E1E|nr:transmembrane 6 superfamily member 1-like [Centruroides sculpturatus]
MSFSNATKVFIVSMLAVPITYIFNGLMIYLRWDVNHPICLLSSVIFLIIAMCFFIVFITRKSPPILNFYEYIHFCVFAIFSFTGVITLITGLELDGIISGFMSAFLKNGEPYLRSAHGAMISYWNGTGMYAMYLMMIAAITWNNTFYEVALFWCGSISNSMVVLLLGILTGKHGITLGSLLYFPYIIIPPVILLQLRHQKQVYQVSQNTKCLFQVFPDILDEIESMFNVLDVPYQKRCHSPDQRQRPLSSYIAVLDTNIIFVQNYLENIEPYLGLKDPAPFPKMQMLVYLFYFLPIYIISIYGLSYPGCTWMIDLSLFHAGAALQAQISHMGASLHPRTPYILRVPPDLYARSVFWIINLILAIIPQLIAYRCMDQPELFVSQSSTINKNGTKLKNN